MEELNKILGIDFNKAVLNLLIDNRTDILINKELLVRALSHLENKDADEIYKHLEAVRVNTRQKIVDSIPKLIA
jgi:hypothetical protein